MNASDIEIIEATYRRRLASLPERMRLFSTEYGVLPRGVILTGPRGCGKSTMLLHHSKECKMLYLSMDNPLLITHSIYQLVSELFMMGYEGVIIDEVHYAAEWSLHLKALYDDFPDKKIWVSDSSALVLRAAMGDLSRRYVSIKMPLMSFREYLFIETGQVYPKYTLGDDLLPVKPDAEILSHFREYRDHGSRPFYLDGDFEARYMGVLDKVLDNDIPFFIPSVNDNNLRLMRAIVGTLAQASVPRVQVTSLCNDWGIGAEKLYQLLFVMESVDLLRIVRLQNDTKARSVGAKMFFADPCAYHVLHSDLGTEREAFIANCFACSGFTVEAMRDEKKGDYVMTPNRGFDAASAITVEVGGKKKTLKGADYVVRDNTDYPVGKAIPFWLLAMMW